MKHFIITATAISVFSTFIFTPNAYAKSGCCSSHGGVCCSCGAQSNGCVICNDGWKGSSCYYSEMVKCGGYTPTTSPTPEPTPSPTPTPTPAPVPVIPVVPPCPVNAKCDDAGNFECNSQYCKYSPGRYCVPLPPNAHCVDNTTGTWECDTGYEEIEEICKKVEVPKMPEIEDIIKILLKYLPDSIYNITISHL